MTAPSDRSLLALLTGALEPDERTELQARVADEPDLQARLALLGERLSETLRPTSRPWMIPPPTLRAPEAPRLWARPLSAMAGDAVRVGDSFELIVDSVPEPEASDIFVLRRVGDAPWQVLFPGVEAERVALSVVPPESDGRRLLRVEAQPPPGPQRYALALVPSAVEVDWTAPEPQRWDAVRASLADGSAPVVSVDVQVVAG